MKAVLFVIGLTISGLAVAQCVTNTYFINGRTIFCQTCCYYGNCTTTCM